jgi:protein involved in sex pheromone biosynthesis
MNKTIISAAIASVFLLNACSKHSEQELSNIAKKTGAFSARF